VPNLPIECLLYGPLRDGDAYVDRVHALADRDPRVRLMGGFEPSQMGRVMRSFDLLALPALWYENDPLVAKAALYLGVPILASRIGTLPEMLKEGQNGWLVEADDPAAWAWTIKNLTEKPLPDFPPVKVKTMNENARELFQIYEAEVKRKR
jgi:glycosyltransferase involved in cell wall biosynthesis